MKKIIPSIMMAVTGLLLFAAFVAQDIRALPQANERQLPWGLILRYGVAMTLGGGLAGYLLSGFFGRSGATGWVKAIVGGLITASIAGVLGSAFGDLPDMASDGISLTDAVRIGAGVLILPLAASGQPLLLVAFILLIVVTHLWCRRARG